MRRFRTRMPEVRLEMTPLMDVIFLLLTFFVFSLVMMIRADVLGVTLPRLATGVNARTGPSITVTVARDGTFAVDGERVEPGALAGAVRARREAAPGATIFIAPDRDTPSAALVDAMNRLGQAGIGEFAVLVQPPQQPGSDR